MLQQPDQFRSIALCNRLNFALHPRHRRFIGNKLAGNLPTHRNGTLQFRLDVEAVHQSPPQASSLAKREKKGACPSKQDGIDEGACRQSALTSPSCLASRRRMGPFLSRFAGEDRSTASIRGLMVRRGGSLPVFSQFRQLKASSVTSRDSVAWGIPWTALDG